MALPSAITRLLPFLGWFPLPPGALKADLVAGITVALVLVPQSMAYAQLAGMPAHHGLYAAFLPVMVAALWGSSAHLGTGPVAVVSLLTAAALAPFAATGSAAFVGLAILLALLVGLIQLTLGALRLGVVVNFLSHPVILGFTNAAAIIIGLSQVSKLLGVTMGRSEFFLADVWGVLAQWRDTHLPTLAMGAGAMAVIWGLKRYFPRMPGVLVAVALTTLLSWAVGFERDATVPITAIHDPAIRKIATEAADGQRRIGDLREQLTRLGADMKTDEAAGVAPQHLAAMRYQMELLNLQLGDVEAENRKRSRDLRRFVFERAGSDPAASLFVRGDLPADAVPDGREWRVARVNGDQLQMRGGGEVVGKVPPGLPGLALPRISLDALLPLLSAALVISLVGFMEAISIAKAMAARSKHHLDPNQELLGQGLANVVSALTQGFPVSGSFSRTAVNFNAGARTGLSSVIAALVVMIVLFWLTPLLYHLPQAVLAAIIIMAVIGLINLHGIRHAWQASRHDGAAAIVTFASTLLLAPHLDRGILIGAGLAILLFLYRSMSPRVAILGRHTDGTLRDIKVVPNLPQSTELALLRFDGQLYFGNVPYFEDAVLEVVASRPGLRYLLVIGDAINHVDASGEEVIRHLAERLQGLGIAMGYSGLKKQVRDVLGRAGARAVIGDDNLFQTTDSALARLAERLGPEAVLPFVLKDAAGATPRTA